MKTFLFCLLLSACTTSFPASTPPPDSTQPTALSPATNFTGKAISQTEIDLSWADQSAGKASYRIEHLSTVGRENDVVVTIPSGLNNSGVNVLAVTGLNASWQYDFILTTLDSAGAVVGSPSTITVQTMLPVVITPPPVTIPPPANGAAPAVCTVFNVHPGDDFVAIAKAAAPGSTLCFAPGNYTVTGTNDASTHIPGKIYNGSGKAVFVKGPSDAKLSLDAGGELYGFTFQQVVFSIEGANDKIHDNRFIGVIQDSGTTDIAHLNQSSSGTTVGHNTFIDAGISPGGGWIGDNNTIEFNSFVFTANQNNQEAIHIVSPSVALTIQNNVIVGTRLRWGIELQSGMHNLRVENNFIQTNVGGLISCATGGDSTPPYAHAGEDIDLSGNILISPNFAGNCGIEIMGDKNITLTNNIFSGLSTGILNGTGGQQNQAATYSNNSFIASNQVSVEQFTWPVPTMISVNNKSFAKGDPAAPKIPAAPSVGARL